MHDMSNISYEKSTTKPIIMAARTQCRVILLVWSTNVVILLFKWILGMYKGGNMRFEIESFVPLHPLPQDDSALIVMKARVMLTSATTQPLRFGRSKTSLPQQSALSPLTQWDNH